MTETEAAVPTIDARCTWKDDYEKLGSYKMNGRCINCEGVSIGLFTKGYRPSDLTFGNRAKCPFCGCDTMSWRGLAE